MSDQFTQNLKTRLAALNSKESVLTLSNWLVFYHKRSFIKRLVSTIQDVILAESNEQRRKLYFGVFHEIIILPDENQSGELDDFKLYLVKFVTKNLVQQLVASPTLKADIEKMVMEWEFVVENLGLIWADIWSKLVISSTDQDKNTTTATKSDNSSETVTVESKAGTTNDQSIEKRPLKRMRSIEDTNDILHAEMLPQCKSIATMQITYELRRDAFARLSNTISLLQEPDLLKISQNEFDLEQNIDILPDAVVDLDIDESKKTISLYRDTVQQMMLMKKKLLDVLISVRSEDKSQNKRCKLGADEAAKDFLKITEKLKFLKEKKREVEDALELEGFEFNDTNGTNDNQSESEDDFALLSWFESDESIS